MRITGCAWRTGCERTFRKSATRLGFRQPEFGFPAPPLHLLSPPEGRAVGALTSLGSSRPAIALPEEDGACSAASDIRVRRCNPG